VAPNPLVPLPSSGPEVPRWSETLRDRNHVVIRPIGALDRQAERDFVDGLSAQARRYRFLGEAPRPGAALVGPLAGIDHAHDVAFAAVATVEGRERIVGVGRYSTDGSGRRCKLVVAVSEDWRDRGLGTKLMRHLVDVARSRGVRKIATVASAENVRMSDLARQLGFRARVVAGDAGQVVHEVAL
jgi:GNAT superfamily N-acetyltransferase